MYEFTNRKTGEILNCNFRMVDPNEPSTMEGFLACLRDEYGETYPRSSVYDTIAFTSELQSGKIIAMLAVSEQGEPAASLALTPCGGLEGVPELTMHVIRKQFRGFGIGTVLTKALLEQPRVKECCAATAHSVTFHPMAQHQTINCGLVPTGFLLNVHSNDILKHSFPVEGLKKQSFAVGLFPESKTDAGALYVPDEHKDFISETYKKLGVTFSACRGEALSGETRLHTHQDEQHHTFTAEIFSCGENMEDLVRQWLDAARFPDQTFNILINMSSPAAPAAYERLRALGFCFTGIHPLCKNGEFLIMHNPMKLELPFDKLCIDEGYREAFEYIRNRA